MTTTTGGQPPSEQTSNVTKFPAERRARKDRARDKACLTLESAFVHGSISVDFRPEHMPPGPWLVHGGFIYGEDDGVTCLLRRNVEAGELTERLAGSGSAELEPGDHVTAASFEALSPAGAPAYDAKGLLHLRRNGADFGTVLVSHPAYMMLPDPDSLGPVSLGSIARITQRVELAGTADEALQRAAQIARTRLQKRLDEAKELAAESPAQVVEHLGVIVKLAAEDGALFGYYGGLLEDEGARAAVVARARASEDVARAGGKARAAAVVQQADDRWRGAALPIARAMRQEKSGETKAKIAREIVRRLEAEGFEPPGDQQIRDTLLLWEKSGDLPSKPS